MSDTRRRIPREPSQTPPYSRHKPHPPLWQQTQLCQQSTGYLLTVPDGARTFRLAIKRDCRATGLREHKRHRSQTRQDLATQDPDTIIAGKVRRYAQIGEDHLL